MLQPTSIDATNIPMTMRSHMLWGSCMNPQNDGLAKAGMEQRSVNKQPDLLHTILGNQRCDQDQQGMSTSKEYPNIYIA